MSTLNPLPAILALATAVLAACTADGTPQERVEHQLGKLISACSHPQGDYSGAAGLVAYTGPDPARRFRALASADGEDRAILNQACFRLGKLLDGSRSYTTRHFEEALESGGTWYVQHVEFANGRTAALAFLEIKGTMALADIDG